MNFDSLSIVNSTPNCRKTKVYLNVIHRIQYVVNRSWYLKSQILPSVLVETKNRTKGDLSEPGGHKLDPKLMPMIA